MFRVGRVGGELEAVLIKYNAFNAHLHSKWPYNTSLTQGQLLIPYSTHTLAPLVLSLSRMMNLEALRNSVVTDQ